VHFGLEHQAMTLADIKLLGCGVYMPDVTPGRFGPYGYGAADGTPGAFSVRGYDIPDGGVMTRCVFGASGYGAVSQAPVADLRETA
jgi:hypothetical protein